ncbi:M15 family metallopeptidase [Lyngbya confervoides]|uniref:D-alanyl-D-alanine carboxypeptidase family protein n=1 Tax=Lyngbya confervoides BDU141951 TaxID=1574623 RepID=A0ABD4T1J2_9CYAN|nr:D-alanyl-D-alanine carboxypeptidase family protein [Lyngbya confervoides]MCM1982516.1 D-alanyl-D-alanine carboxypeptidase family protein [Lyngbya confervoides BDU141951]
MKHRSRLHIHSPFQFIALTLLAAIVTVWIGMLVLFAWRQMAPPNQVDDIPDRVTAAPPTQASPPRIPATPAPPQPSQAVPTPSASPPLSDNPSILSTADPQVAARGGEPHYNHLPYQEATGELMTVGEYYDRPEQLVPEVAQAFWTMQDAAAASGIRLGPISGFRTIADQAQLFERQIQRHGGSAQEAATLSAPPGYSEHHTGYTLDIRDLDQPDTDLKYAMENTAAYRWLLDNGCTYGFELSFPEGNRQGVSFEPWHWRYIGSPQAKQLFANAHQRYPHPTYCNT